MRRPPPHAVNPVQTLVLCGLLLALTGCLIPVGTKVTGGYHYSKEALAFLDQPGTTRAEVVATLGPPLLESSSTRTLVYAWQEIPKYLFLPSVKASGTPDGMHVNMIKGSPDQWALFIALDEQGIVLAHEDRYVATRSLEQECHAWDHRRNK